MSNYPGDYPSQPQNETPEGAPQAQQVQARLRQAQVPPYVTYTIMAVTILFYVLQQLSSTLLRGPMLNLVGLVMGQDVLQQVLTQGYNGDLLVLLGGKINELIVAGQYWRLLTPALLHANILHIGFNMYAIYIFGPSLEAYYGHTRYLLLYVLGAFGGNALSFLMSTGISIGASTAIFALISAEAVFIYQNRALFGPRARPMLTNVVIIAVVNLLLGLSPGIDNWGHMGGLLAGLIFAWFAGPQINVEGIWPTYELVDKRATSTAWLVSAVDFAVFAAVTYLGILKNR